LVLGLVLGDTLSAWSNFNLYLWPDGRVPYRWADANDTDWWGDAAVPLTVAQRRAVRAEMDAWEAAMRLADPADPAQTRQYIRFERCAGRCEDEDQYLLIRLNNNTRRRADGTLRETNNMCSWRDDGFDVPGRNPAAGGMTVLHFAPGQDANTLRHELGHCLGLWHEFNRQDRDAWLDEKPNDVDGADAWDAAALSRPVSLGEMPQLGNYDYDSLMNYGSLKAGCVLRWLDLLGNRFERRGLDMVPQDSAGTCRFFPADAGGSREDQVSDRDKSRILQYYAREAQANWGFFESIAAMPGLYDYDGRPDPLLAPGVGAVGTPAIAHQSAGNYDVFARGSNDRLYWKSFRRVWLPFEPEPVDQVSGWTSLGCCFGSDPAAISRGDGQIDVVAIGATTGRPLRRRLVNGAWQAWSYVTDGVPGDGLRQTPGGGYIGPAVASRTPDTLDVFVVQSDGRLAATTLAMGVWQGWRTLGIGYEVTARPAAVAESAYRVRLAINEREVNLYEPRVTFGWPWPPSIDLGQATAQTAPNTAPGITSRASANSPYRVLIVTSDNRIAHKFAGGRWRDIGGIPQSGTGVSAVATGAYSALLTMNGEDVTGCDRTCLDGQPQPNGAFIQAGGLWLREFR
jgi:hypothetical protein